MSCSAAIEGIRVAGKMVSFSDSKGYNIPVLQRRNSFGKDKGSVNRRGTEPFVFYIRSFHAHEAKQEATGSGGFFCVYRIAQTGKGLRRGG